MLSIYRHLMFVHYFYQYLDIVIIDFIIVCQALNTCAPYIGASHFLFRFGCGGHKRSIVISTNKSPIILSLRCPIDLVV